MCTWNKKHYDPVVTISDKHPDSSETETPEQNSRRGSERSINTGETAGNPPAPTRLNPTAMKTSQKLLLASAAIIIGTAIGVNLIYSLVTYIGKERSLGEEHTYTLHAERGRIFDADGNILARTDTLYDIGLDCTIIKYEEVWENLSPMLAGQLAGLFSQRDSTDWQQRLDESRADKNRYLVIANGVSKEDANAVRSFPIFDLGQYQGGGIVKPRYIRTYPFGMLGRSTIGESGLELQYGAVLTGVDGRQEIRYGRYLGRDVRKATESAPAINGKDIHTTLNMRMMSVADSVLRAAIDADKDVDAGCLVVMEVATGAIQCVVNLTKTSDGIIELENLVNNRTFVLYQTLATGKSILPVYNAIGNRGEEISPYLVEYVSDGDSIESMRSEYSEQMMPESVADSLFSTMAHIGPDIVGETVLCETNMASDREEEADISIAFFPAEAPTYSIMGILYGNGVKRSRRSIQVISEFANNYEYEED